MPLNDIDEFSGDVLYESERPVSLEIGNVEIGAVREVIKKARDNRRPAPKMRAVGLNAPLWGEVENWGVANVCIGVAESTGDPDPFPLTSGFLLRFGAGGEPRIVRVDTESSYKRFRAEKSPELTDLRARIDELSRRLKSHEDDPHAHAAAAEEFEELTLMGEAVKQAEQEKRVDLWLPKHFEGKWTAWHEGDLVCASILLPGADGEVRICTSVEPIRRCVEEMARHAAEADVPAVSIIGLIPAMGSVLGAATVIKEMVAAAPSILQQPEAAGTKPFLVRIEPKTNPSLCALAALTLECRKGNSQACEEWERLRAAAPGPIRALMAEAMQLLKDAA